MHTKNRFSHLLLPALLITFLFSACRKEKPTSPGTTPPPNEEELITTVVLRLSDGGTQKEFRWSDLSGSIVVTGDTLTAGTTYAFEVLFLNESVTPTDTVNHEIEAEAEEHQVFVLFNGVNAIFTYEPTDVDANGRPLGLRGSITAGAPGAGTMQVVLLHEPLKEAPGVSDGDITNAGGEIDAEPEFPLVIE